MFKLLIFLTFVVNIAIASERFNDADKTKFLKDVKVSIAEHKLENRGKVSLQLIKPGFYAELEVYRQQQKFTNDEMIILKQNFEIFSKKKIADEKVEQEFYNFIERELSELNKIPLVKTQEGQICNTWNCEEGLKCAPDPLQHQQQSGREQQQRWKGKKSGVACSENDECASSECVQEAIGSKNKVCEEVYRCFKPLVVGNSCNQNPVCAQGSCLPFNSLTSGIGECDGNGNICKRDADCCSGLCSGGTCKPNKICKDCVISGSKPQRSQKCCEGLYLNESGVCVPDVPPSVIPQVRVSPMKKMFIVMSSLIISNVYAEEGSEATSTPDSTPASLEVAGAKEAHSGAAASIEMKNEIMTNKDKYEAFQAKSNESPTLDMKSKKANIEFEKKSDFVKCDIHFKHDFYNSMKADGVFDLEVAMLAFDFVITGDSDPDYWTKGSSAGGETSIYSRLKSIGVEHRKLRKDNNLKIENINKKLTCLCLDVQGYKKIENADKKKYFETQCEEYAKYQDPTTNYDELEGDASGLKAKRLLNVWATNMAAFHETLTIDNNTAFKKFLEVSTWSQNEAKWNDARDRNYDLFKFNIKNQSSSTTALGALIGALLAAGVIAVLGGFASTSIISAWGAAGIISASAVTGAGGLWMIASLKGAWISHRPQISDNVVQPRGYSCGKKETCTEYTRTLIQPFNDICGIHASANACIKKFVVIKEGNEFKYIVDPWIPNAGTDEKSKALKTSILLDQQVYTDGIENGFAAARKLMVDKNPGAGGGGDKKGGGDFVAESYLSDVFIEADVIGHYAPNALKRDGVESAYLLNESKIEAIKAAARAFAVSEGFLTESDKEDLNQFADYAYEYHFIWPKKSRPNEISYPTVGLTTYLSYMTSDVAGELTTGLANTTKKLNNLKQKYLTDYKKNLELYKEKATNVPAAGKNALQNEINAVQKELDNVLTLNSMLNNKSFDSQLSNLSSGFLNDQSKLAGANAVAQFSQSQKDFLKAVGGLRKTRQDQLKSLDTYNKAMAKNGDKDRAARVSKASRNFSNKFSRGNSGFGNAFGSSGNGSGSEESAIDNSESSRASFKPTTLDNSGYGDGGAGGLYGSASSVSRKSNNSYPGGSGDSASRSSDQNKIAEAIDARNKNKSKYEATDGQTLFEQITKAYIRNYDKVLNKKKDKDVIEQNQ